MAYQSLPPGEEELQRLTYAAAEGLGWKSRLRAASRKAEGPTLYRRRPAGGGTTLNVSRCARRDAIWLVELRVAGGAVVDRDAFDEIKGGL